MSYYFDSSMDYEVIQEMIRDEESSAATGPEPFPASVLPGVLARVLKEQPLLAHVPIYTLSWNEAVPIHSIGFSEGGRQRYLSTSSVLQLFVEVTLMLETGTGRGSDVLVVNDAHPICSLWRRDASVYRLIAMYDRPPSMDYFVQDRLPCDPRDLVQDRLPCDPLQCLDGRQK